MPKSKVEIMELDCAACSCHCKHQIIPTIGTHEKWVYKITCTKCGFEETK